jgi:hypothetical protein
LRVVKLILGVLFILLGIYTAFAWTFREQPHYESAENSGIGGDLVEKGQMLWKPEGGFVVHAVAAEAVAIGLGIVGVLLAAGSGASFIGWVVLVIASAIPGVAAFLFQWDRIALSRTYFTLALASCLLWWGVKLMRGEKRA